MPAFTRNAKAVGAAQQSLEDKQYFVRLADRAKDNDILGMMLNVSDYAAMTAMPPSSFRLPMSPGQPDFVFSDEEDAVLAIKHGAERLFFNFYFRQEYGVTGVTRLLVVDPDKMQIESVMAHTEVERSGHEWTRPDIIDMERTGGIPPPNEHIHQAFAGEKVPIAKRPDDAQQPAYGSWGPFVGKAAFYWLHYGDYLIGINTTDSKSYAIPALQLAEAHQAVDLVSGKSTDLTHSVEVGPLSTVVLYAGKAER